MRERGKRGAQQSLSTVTPLGLCSAATLVPCLLLLLQAFPLWLASMNMQSFKVLFRGFCRGSINLQTRAPFLPSVQHLFMAAGPRPSPASLTPQRALSRSSACSQVMQGGKQTLLSTALWEAAIAAGAVAQALLTEGDKSTPEFTSSCITAIFFHFPHKMHLICTLNNSRLLVEYFSSFLVAGLFFFSVKLQEFRKEHNALHLIRSY